MSAASAFPGRAALDVDVGPRSTSGGGLDRVKRPPDRPGLAIGPMTGRLANGPQTGPGGSVRDAHVGGLGRGPRTSGPGPRQRPQDRPVGASPGRAALDVDIGSIRRNGQMARGRAAGTAGGSASGRAALDIDVGLGRGPRTPATFPSTQAGNVKGCRPWTAAPAERHAAPWGADHGIRPAGDTAVGWCLYRPTVCVGPQRLGAWDGAGVRPAARPLFLRPHR